MSIIDRIKEKAKTELKHIVLAEGSEPRTVQASAKIVAEGLAKITLIGKEAEIRKVAEETGTDLTGVSIVDPALCEKSEAYAVTPAGRGRKSAQAKDFFCHVGKVSYFCTRNHKLK